MRAAGWIAAPALVLSASNQAYAAPCWTAQAINGARVHELQVMLMTVGLRCKAAGMDIRASYENFEVAQSKALTEADKAIRLHFGADASKAGRSDYNVYMTRLGNLYGTGRTDVSSCKLFKSLADSLAKPSASGDDLSARSMEVIRDPQLDAPRCPARR